MKSFISFLNESNSNLIQTINELELSIDDTDAQNLLTVEELIQESSSTSSPFDQSDSTFVLMDLDDSDTMDESETKDVLSKRRGAHRSSQEVRDSAAQYKMVPDKSNPNGYKLMRKSSRFSDEPRHELESHEEIDAIIKQLNKSPKSTKFKFENGVLMTANIDSNNPSDDVSWKKLSVRSKSKWIKALNNVMEKNGIDVYYKFEQITDKKNKVKFGDKILKNAEPLKPDAYNPNIKDPSSVDYIELNKEDEEKILDVLNKASQKQKKDNSQYGFDFDKKCFTKDGKPITDKSTFAKLVDRLNGGVKQSDHNKWNHFAFSKDGSKIGAHVGSFSLPPVESCAADVPCADQGCYALKSYGLYPQVGAIWDNNLALLHDGKYDQFISEAVTFITKAKLTHFRFSVSGDIFCKEYLHAVLEVCKQCKNTTFWLYTKFYNLFKGVSVPSNLTVILSAWGKFQPPEDMAKKFPVAFLLDEDDPEMMQYVPKGIKICPCTDGKDAHCDTCKICFSDLAKNNLAFKKH